MAAALMRLVAPLCLRWREKAINPQSPGAAEKSAIHASCRLMDSARDNLAGKI
jgi:hypothetical protein